MAKRKTDGEPTLTDFDRIIAAQIKKAVIAPKDPNGGGKLPVDQESKASRKVSGKVDYPAVFDRNAKRSEQQLDEWIRDTDKMTEDPEHYDEDNDELLSDESDPAELDDVYNPFSDDFDEGDVAELELPDDDDMFVTVKPRKAKVEKSVKTKKKLRKSGDPSEDDHTGEFNGLSDDDEDSGEAFDHAPGFGDGEEPVAHHEDDHMAEDDPDAWSEDNEDDGDFADDESWDDDGDADDDGFEDEDADYGADDQFQDEDAGEDDDDIPGDDAEASGMRKSVRAPKVGISKTNSKKEASSMRRQKVRKALGADAMEFVDGSPLIKSLVDAIMDWHDETIAEVRASRLDSQRKHKQLAQENVKLRKGLLALSKMIRVENRQMAKSLATGIAHVVTVPTAEQEMPARAPAAPVRKGYGLPAQTTQRFQEPVEFDLAKSLDTLEAKYQEGDQRVSLRDITILENDRSPEYLSNGAKEILQSANLL